jgi:PTH1 family peptidyl-tRNA hydrolase
MKLIIGLGNPGKEYENTRHNVGFKCVDLLCEKLSAPPFALQKKFDALVTEVDYKGEKILLAKPQTFMNASGDSVQKLFNFYHCEHGDLWIIYDDIDLELGKIRVRPNGSPGSHNGMKSTVSSLGFNGFPRIRIGIESRGVLAPKEQEISSFVLHAFSKEEDVLARNAIKNASEALLTGLTEGVKTAQEKYN